MRNTTTLAIRHARNQYYSEQIKNSVNNTRGLYDICNKILGRQQLSPLPVHSSAVQLANDFNDYFVEKIDKIRTHIEDTLQTIDDHEEVSTTTAALNPDCNFSVFRKVSVDEVTKIITSSPGSSCEQDPISTKFLKANIDILATGITSIVNASLQSGNFTSNLKKALIRPLLKKSNLPTIFKNYRPVSNLCFISKIIEKCVAKQVHEHASQHQLGEKFQSAYKSHHSTETAIVKVKSDILEKISKKKVTALILLDLSAAFDTVDHQILLDRLKTRFGISGIPLKWFQDYLTERHQQVVIDGSKSEPVLLKQGVPQGSVLGPLCFTYYTAPLGDICRKHNIIFHLYADDTTISVF